MTQKDAVSICIPTCNRRHLLLAAIESCFAQEYRPLEILIGDDSADETTRVVISRLQAPKGISLKYIRNSPPLRQAANVNNLFQHATAPRLMLLHDDDLLIPGALGLLAKAWDAYDDVAAVYGKRYVITEAGEILWSKTKELNARARATKASEGPQPSSIVAGLRQQIPNNGYLVRTDLARAVRCRPTDIIGRHVDWDFGIRLGIAAEPLKFIYVDEYTVKYRLTLDSVARSGLEPTNVHLLHKSVMEMAIPKRYRDECVDVYNRLTVRALRSCIELKERRWALRLLLSAEYGGSIRWLRRTSTELL
jgi:glycosyltransferase involved in cell wall biosynthesis